MCPAEGGDRAQDFAPAESRFASKLSRTPALIRSPPCSSPSTSATRRPCSACSRASVSPTPGASPPTRAAPETSSSSCSAGCSTPTRSTGSASRRRFRAPARVGAARRPVGARAAARGRARGPHRHPDPLRRPSRGRPRPDRQRGGGKDALRRAGDRRRLRHLDELRRRLARRASTSAACSRPGSRRRWTRCSPAPRGS